MSPGGRFVSASYTSVKRATCSLDDASSSSAECKCVKYPIHSTAPSMASAKRGDPHVRGAPIEAAPAHAGIDIDMYPGGLAGPPGSNGHLLQGSEARHAEVEARPECRLQLLLDEWTEYDDGFLRPQSSQAESLSDRGNTPSPGTRPPQRLHDLWHPEPIRVGLHHRNQARFGTNRGSEATVVLEQSIGPHAEPRTGLGVR